MDFITEWALQLDVRAAVYTKAKMVFGKGCVTLLAVACKLYQRCEGFDL